MVSGAETKVRQVTLYEVNFTYSVYEGEVEVVNQKEHAS